MNPTNGVTKVAADLVAGLKSSPVLLTIVAMQAITLGLVSYGSIVRQRTTSEQFNHIYGILNRCVPDRKPAS